MMQRLIAHLHIHLPLLLTLTVLSKAQPNPLPDPSVKRIAIIGAGAAGTSTAYHLHRYARNASLPISITVFDKNDYVGGRSTTVPVYDDATSGQSVELGASIFVQVNRILMDAVKEFGLRTEGFGAASRERSASLEEEEEGGSGEQLSGGNENDRDRSSSGELDDGEPMREVLGVWNGEEFVYTQSLGKMKWWQDWWMKGKLLWRYGLAPVRTVSLMKSVTGKFFRMYDEPVFPWREGLSQAVLDVGLLETTAYTGEQFLGKNNIGLAFAREIIQSSTRVNYAQNLGLIHGLETMVCMATDGAMSVVGGNYQIFASMLNASSSTTKLSTKILEVRRQHNGTYVLVGEGRKLGHKTTQPYDAVVLAAPYHQSGIKFSSASKKDDFPANIPPDVPYVTLHVTLFASPNRLSPLHFNLTSPNMHEKGSSTTNGPEVPNVILTTLPESQQADLGSVMDGTNAGKAGFFSISALREVKNKKFEPPRSEYVYKIFSPEPISDSFLESLVGGKPSSKQTSRWLQADESDTQVPIQEYPHQKTNDNQKLVGNGVDTDIVTWVHRHAWKSYPYLPPRVTFEEQKLDEFGLWYTSGIESFISTMETSALMGANVAKLIVDGWTHESKIAEEHNANKGHQDL